MLMENPIPHSVPDAAGRPYPKTYQDVCPHFLYAAIEKPAFSPGQPAIISFSTRPVFLIRSRGTLDARRQKIFA